MSELSSSVIIYPLIMIVFTIFIICECFVKKPIDTDEIKRKGKGCLVA
jgi:hypothetical protein